MRLLVRDNGKGFDTEQDSDGFGLLGMRERIALLDGELEIESAPQRGTVIRAPPTRPATRLTSSYGASSQRVLSGHVVPRACPRRKPDATEPSMAETRWRDGS